MKLTVNGIPWEKLQVKPESVRVPAKIYTKGDIRELKSAISPF